MLLRHCQLLAVVIVSGIASALAADCSSEKQIRELDSRYERALLDGSVADLEQILHPKFVWVHNHAEFIQKSRDELVGPIRLAQNAGRPSISLRRDQSDVSVLMVAATGVAYGYTEIERTDAFVKSSGSPKLATFHFMRTYVSEAGRCLLISNQTMEVSRSGGPGDNK